MAQQPEYMHPRENPEFRSASTLSADVIRNAVIYDDRNAQRTIKEYGRLRAKIFNELIRDADPSES